MSSGKIYWNIKRRQYNHPVPREGCLVAEPTGNESDKVSGDGSRTVQTFVVLQ